MLRTILAIYSLLCILSVPCAAVEVTSQHIANNQNIQKTALNKNIGWFTTEFGIYKIDAQTTESMCIYDGQSDIMSMLTMSDESAFCITNGWGNVYRIDDTGLTEVSTTYDVGSDIYVDSQNRLWTYGCSYYGTSNEIITTYYMQLHEGNTVTTLYSSENSPGNRIILDETLRKLYFISFHLKMVCLTFDETYTTIVDTSYISCPFIPHIDASEAQIAIDSQGTLWVAEDTLYTYTHEGWEEHDSITGIISMLVCSPDTLWLGTSEGLYQIAGTDTSFYTKTDGLPSSIITTLDETEDGTVWVGTTSGLATWDGTSFHTVSNSMFPDTWGNAIMSIAKDTEGDIWCIAGQKVYEISGDLITYHEINNNILFYTVFVGNDGNVWVGGSNGMVYRFADDEWESLPIETNQHVNDFFIDENNTLWAHCYWTSSNLYMFENGQWEDATPWDAYISIHDILVDNDGTIWLGSSYDYALLKIENGVFFNCTSQYEQLNGKGHVMQLAEDSANKLWFVLDYNSTAPMYLSYIENDQLIVTDVDLPISVDYPDMFFDQNDILWVTSYRYGCCAYDGNEITQYNIANGYLINNDVHVLFIDSNNDKWLGTLGGITVLSDVESNYVNESQPEPLNLSNYPNPFNPSTTISFTLPQNGFTSLTIYSISGQKICELKAEPMLAGTYSIIWNGRDSENRILHSGIYISQLRMGSYTISKKMLLLK